MRIPSKTQQEYNIPSTRTLSDTPTHAFEVCIIARTTATKSNQTMAEDETEILDCTFITVM